MAARKKSKKPRGRANRTPPGPPEPRAKPGAPEYRAKPGARLTKKAVEDLGPLIDRLARAGRPPEDLVKLAKSPRSKAHKHFLWDDRAAGHKYRVEQARYFFRTIVIEVEDIHEDVRLTQCVTVDGERQWGHVDVIREDVNMLHSLLQSAQRDLIVFYRRYQQLRKLGHHLDIFESIERNLLKDDDDSD